MQETHAAGLEGADSLKDEAAAKPWLLTIIRREYARSFERKRLATVDVDELIASEEPMLAAVAGSGSRGAARRPVQAAARSIASRWCCRC